MREIFVNPQTGDVWRYGDIFSWPNLAQTYEKIAKNGGEEFYSGETMKLMMEDYQKHLQQLAAADKDADADADADEKASFALMLAPPLPSDKKIALLLRSFRDTNSKLN